MELQEMHLLTVVSRKLDALHEIYKIAEEEAEKVGKDIEKLNELLEKSNGEKCGCKDVKNPDGSKKWLIDHLRYLADGFESGKYALKHYDTSNEIRMTSGIDGCLAHEMTGDKTLSLTWSK